MNQEITISLAQIDIRLGDVAANLTRGQSLVQEAARRGSDLVVFPELWTTGYDLARASDLAESLPDGPTCQMLAAWAGEHNIWITGSMMLHGASGVFNAAPLFGPQGQIAGPYRKMHRFGPMEEDRWLEAGKAPGWWVCEEAQRYRSLESRTHFPTRADSSQYKILLIRRIYSQLMVLRVPHPRSLASQNSSALFWV